MDSVKMDLQTGLARHFYADAMANAALIFAVTSLLRYRRSPVWPPTPLRTPA
jgi:hypothetical protein